MIDFSKAFSFPFQTQNWVEKLLLPALVTLIPIFGQIFLLGWYLDVTRRVIHGNDDPLPDLDLGRQFVEGLKALIISLVYALPILVLVVPIILVSAAASNNTGQASGAANAGVALVSLCFTAFILVYGLLLAFVLPAALANFVAHEDIAAAFRFPEVFGLLRAAPAVYLVVLLLTLLTSMIASLGSVVCFIGVAATTLYAFAVNGYLYGDAYRVARGQAA